MISQRSELPAIEGLEMANTDQLERIRQGYEVWNAWRRERWKLGNSKHAAFKIDLTGADLRRVNLYSADLFEANLSGANLSGVNLSGARLVHANLSGACLRKAFLMQADMSGASAREANFCGADINGADLGGAYLWRANLHAANLRRADFSGAVLSEANLSEADISYATMVDVNLSDADLSGCRIYGISAWGIALSERTKQQNLVISQPFDPEITVDNIEVAQFIYLLLRNASIRNIIDTITSKIVLILGSFTKGRKKVLDTIRDSLRNRNLLPVIFDFSVPGSRDVTETIKVLAGLARFIIADITDATEVRVELHNVVRDFTSLPIQPILLRGQAKFVSMSHLRRFPWLLPSFEYDSEEHLLDNLDARVVGPAEAKVLELRAP
jgi:uncharacterized protein YjbI with pentapeptide repeats